MPLLELAFSRKIRLQKNSFFCRKYWHFHNMDLKDIKNFTKLCKKSEHHMYGTPLLHQGPNQLLELSLDSFLIEQCSRMLVLSLVLSSATNLRYQPEQKSQTKKYGYSPKKKTKKDGLVRRLYSSYICKKIRLHLENTTFQYSE